MNDDFYIGYLSRAPAGASRFLKRVSAALLVSGSLAAISLVLSQQPFAWSVFEFGKERALQGVVEEHPYPTLMVPRPGAENESAPYSRYLLVGTGKHGARVDGFDGRQVRLMGTLIHRDGKTAVEVVDGSMTAAGGPSRSARMPGVGLGSVTLRGEIVDSKCYFGVMNPGAGKVHRACAARCISGGIPPVFIATDRDGVPVSMLLAGGAGERINSRVLDLVGETVEITGELTRSGDLLTLAADPATYRRLRE